MKNILLKYVGQRHEDSAVCCVLTPGLRVLPASDSILSCLEAVEEAGLEWGAGEGGAMAGFRAHHLDALVWLAFLKVTWFFEKLNE